jgi:hypothetical protein
VRKINLPIFELGFDSGVSYETKFDDGRIRVTRTKLEDFEIERKLSFLKYNVTIIVEDEHQNSVRAQSRYERGQSRDRFVPILRGIMADSEGEILTDNCLVESVSLDGTNLKFKLSRINLTSDSDMF